MPSQRGNLRSVDTPQRSRGLALLPLATFAIDAVAVTTMLLLAALARELSWFPPAPVQPSLVVIPALAVGWLGAVWMRGGYEQAVLGAGVDEYKRVLQASVMIVAFVGILCYLARYPLPRSFFLLAFFMVCGALLAGRFTLRLVVRRARRKGAMLHRVLVVGTTSHANDVVKVLERERWLGYDIVGVVNAGSASAIVGAVGRVQADVVFLAGGAVESSDDVRRIAWELESRHTRVVVAPGLTEVAPERVRLRPVAGVPLIHLDKPRAAGAVRSAKRIFDVVGASILLVAFSPLFAFSAWQIRRHDGGPLLFSHERVGRDGVPFGCLKFRTMVVDAQAQLAAVHADLGEEVGIFYKIKDDPRITPPGRWMRRFSVDELPQLLNVLRGDMSLVGPRPQIADEVALYDDAMARRLHVRPGMTGLWQVSGRSDLSLEEAMRLDLYYVDNWSMSQDVAILSRTVRAVFGSSGAY